MAITRDFATGIEGLSSAIGLRLSAVQGTTIPKCGSMRRKMASAVDGCWYSLWNVVPDICSRYSNERRDELDMMTEA